MQEVLYFTYTANFPARKRNIISIGLPQILPQKPAATQATNRQLIIQGIIIDIFLTMVDNSAG
jgi:hypothetical protein